MISPVVFSYNGGPTISNIPVHMCEQACGRLYYVQCTL